MVAKYLDKSPIVYYSLKMNRITVHNIDINPITIKESEMVENM